MIKMLVDAPTGEQKLIVTEAGAITVYFDEARVLWDERTEGPMPAITLGGMVKQGNTLVFDQARKNTHDASLIVIPDQVTMRQARLALLAAGKLDAVQLAIDAIPDATQKRAAQITWDSSSAVERNNAFVSMLAPALGLTSSQLDQLFTTAATL